METELVILCGGGSSSEKEISKISGETLYQHARKIFKSRKIVLEADELPSSLTPSQDIIIFPITHGEFGEDGQLQHLMEERGLTFIGCDAASSALCMDKFATKERVRSANVPMVKGIKFNRHTPDLKSMLLEEFPDGVFIKPNAKGSSVDAHYVCDLSQLDDILQHLHDYDYLAEELVQGIDFSVGILDGQALEVAELRPVNTFFDFESKYTAGMAEEICPAHLSPELTYKMKKYAEAAYHACGCRDWARVDFLLSKNGEIIFTEINTLPGMSPASIFPKCAMAFGMTMDDVIKKLFALALDRHHQK